jgi:hypothetical protein
MIGFRPAISGLLECGVPSHRFPCLVRSKATRRRVALSKLREIEQRFFLFAFIRVIRGLSFGCGGAALRTRKSRMLIWEWFAKSKSRSNWVITKWRSSEQ